MRYGRHTKVKLPITVNTLEILLSYLLNMRKVNRRFIRNIMKLTMVLDISVYENDDYFVFLIDSLKYLSDLRMSGVDNITYIRNSYLQAPEINHEYSTKFVNKFDVYKLTREEHENIEYVIRDFVEYIEVYISRNELIDAYDRVMSANAKKVQSGIKDIKRIMSDVLVNIRSAEVTRENEMTVLLSRKAGSVINDVLSNLYDELTDPSNLYKTGLKELNRFLMGGHVKGCTYLYVAPTNSCKSLLLLYIGLWTLAFNPKAVPKDMSKSLGILLITCENTVNQTLARIYAIFTDGLIDPKNVSKEQFMAHWKDILSALETNFQIFIEYAAPGATVEKIKTIKKQVEEENNVEITMLILDHLGNLGNSNPHANGESAQRQSLITNIYDLSDWAKTSEFALITAMHNSSTFDDVLKTAQEEGKHNLVRLQGRHRIADARYIERAVDCAIYLVKEKSPLNGKKYVGFKYEKRRDKETEGSDIFYHELTNGIILRHDEGTLGTLSHPCIPGTENVFAQQNMQNTIPISGDPFASHVSLSASMAQQNTTPIGPKMVIEDNPDDEVELTEEDFESQEYELEELLLNSTDPYAVLNDDDDFEFIEDDDSDDPDFIE